MNYDSLNGLNDEQKLAVTSTEGYVRVIAGAGSGKTRALTNRYVYLVQDVGISTANILCVTFTNKAANEMKKRIRHMIGDYDTALVCTFHGFCVKLLREDIHTMHYPENFLVIDSEDIDTILRNVYQEAKIDSKRYTFSMAKDMIAARKYLGQYIPYILETDIHVLKDYYLKSVKIEDRIFFGYLYEQRKCFGLDYDDLILFALYVLENFDDKREKWQKRLEYIMVDEFQDVSSSQYALVTILSDYHKNLFVVGDPDQTIYSWRGAKIEYILDFDKKFPNVTTIIMDRNYRSSENILNASNSLIKKNKKRLDKELKAVKSLSVPVIYHHARTTKEEAAFIVKQIDNIVAAGKSLNDITILYRSHFVSRSIEEEFIKEKIPYVLYSGIEFYKRKEIKDILSYFRMLIFEDDLSFLRVVNVPRRNIGDKRIQLLKDYAENNDCSLFKALKENLGHELIVKSNADEFVELIEKYRKLYKDMKLTDLLSSILNDSGYESMLRTSGENERLDNLAELKQAIFEYENSTGEETYLEDYLQMISLYSNSDKEDKKDSVKMMTIHNAKGLEFPYVFLCGLNEGIFPNKHVNSLDRLEEERRLAYVAYTRAENALFLSDAEGINFDGSYRYPSRFIFNTDKAYLEYTKELEQRLVDDAIGYIIRNEKKITPEKSDKMNIGDIVLHKVFGRGKIIEIHEDTASYGIQFDKLETNRNISFNVSLQKVQ